MTSTIDFDSIDRLISNAGIGSFELDTSLPVAEPIAPKPQKRTSRISPDFLVDLDLAGRRVLGAISELLQTEKGSNALMTALDGLPSAARTREGRARFLVALQSFANGSSQLQFLPAANAAAPSVTDSAHTLPNNCSCALDPDLSTAYVSADLGFRDLFQTTQSTAIKALILHLEPLGIINDPVQAFSKVSGLLGHDVIDLEEEAMMEETWLGTPAGQTLAYATAFHPAT